MRPARERRTRLQAYRGAAGLGTGKAGFHLGTGAGVATAALVEEITSLAGRKLPSSFDQTLDLVGSKGRSHLLRCR
jgi:hypothetical protein